jgi:hypothetical protein
VRLGVDFGNVLKVHGEPRMVPFALEALTSLKEEFFGDEIYLVSRVYEARHIPATLDFLERYSFFEGTLSPQKVYFCYHRHEKAHLARMLGLTHFVDDRPDCLYPMEITRYRYLFNPTQADLEKFPCVGLIRVKEWGEIYRHLKETVGP